MSLYIYNTVTRQKERFQSLEHNRVKIYVCGPTVYDYIHIGNARPIIFFDVVRRYLETIGYEVTHIVNFTDVDDKLIHKAAELGITVPEVADRFIQAFYEDIDGLGIQRASYHPRVTENINKIISFIRHLLEQEMAYEAGGDVYFRTKKYKSYGKISGQNIEELQLGIRVEVNEHKEDAIDFVLWKVAKPGEICWDSPWGQGRPGWHIECSAMVHKYLGDTIDIHGGGEDLQFPHHECEVAQSESMTGKPLANIWMHNGYVNINEQKMSKSLRNSVFVHQLRKRYHPAALRYCMLATHYRNPVNFSTVVMEQAEKSIARLQNAFTNIQHAQTVCIATSSQQADHALQNRLTTILHTFHHKMQDDFNTADAITAMFEWANEANLYLQSDIQLSVSNDKNLQALLDTFHAMNHVLGFVWAEKQELVDEQIMCLIQEREEARKIKNWGRADEIRNLLTAQGILLEDTAQGIRWRRTQ